MTDERHRIVLILPDDSSLMRAHLLEALTLCDLPAIVVLGDEAHTKPSLDLSLLAEKLPLELVEAFPDPPAEPWSPSNLPRRKKSKKHRRGR